MASLGHPLKMVVVGDGAVGKTSLLVSYTQGILHELYEPTVFETYSGKITVGEKVHNFTLWDTAGQEGFDRCRVLCYPGVMKELYLSPGKVNQPYSSSKDVWMKFCQPRNENRNMSLF